MSNKSWLSILGLYNWDNTIFDNMVLPEDFTADDKTTLINNLLMETAELEVLYTDPDFMKNAIEAWSAKEVYTWTRLYDAMMAQYSPIENFDRYEDVDEQNRGAMTHSGTDSVSGSGEDTITNKITSFDNNTFVDHDKAIAGKGSTDTTTYGHVVTDSTGKKIISHLHGNIGVTTNQQMLEAELQTRPKINIYRIIIDSFRERFCLLVY